MDQFKRRLLENASLNRAATQGRETVGAKAAPHLGGLTPEQIAQVERIAAKLPPGQLQQVLSGAFAKLDPATLNQIAEKLAASGSPAPGGKRTDPATLALLAATAMRGRAGGIAGLLMILAGSAVANRRQAAPQARGGSSTLASAGKSMAGALGNLAEKAADAGSRSASPRVRTGAAHLHNMTALAGSPLARNVMSQLGPAILKMGKAPKP